jgi:hypothetical protein
MLMAKRVRLVHARYFLLGMTVKRLQITHKWRPDDVNLSGL